MEYFLCRDSAHSCHRITNLCAPSSSKTWLRFLKGEPELSRRYENGDLELTGYSDSSYAGCDSVSSKSSAGVTFFMDNGVISYASGLHRLSMQSSAESELIALVDAAKNGNYLRRLRIKWDQRIGATHHPGRQHRIVSALS